MRAFILVICLIGLAWFPGVAPGADPPPVFREEVSTHQLTLLLREGDGAAVAARVSVLDPATGAPYWPDDPTIPTYEAYTGHNYFYADNQVRVTVNAGWVRILATRGPEYSVVDRTVYVWRDLVWGVSFTRLFDPAAYDLYSGDTHVHIAHGGEGAVYTITNEDLALAARAEDLNVTCGLSNGPYFNGGLDPAGDAGHLVHFGVEYRSALYGHMGVIGLTSLLSQFGCCLPGEPAQPLNLDIQKEAHARGGLVSYAHPATIDPTLMGNTTLDWPYSGFAREAPVDVLIGEVDAYDIFSYSNTNQNTSRKLWFDLLNLGRYLPLSVGTDASLNRYFDPPPGGYRVYVKTPGGLDFDAWRVGLRAGHSFATNGPLILEFTLGGAEPGDILNLPATGDDPLVGHLRLQSRTPATQLEIYECGILVHNELLPAYSGELVHSFQVARPKQSGWLVARVTGPRGSEVDVGPVLEAVTSPIRVVRGNLAMTPRTIQKIQFTSWIEQLQGIVLEREGWDDPKQAAMVWNDIEPARLLLAADGRGHRTRPDIEHFEQLGRLGVVLAPHDDGLLFRAEGSGEGALEVFDVQGRPVYVSPPQRLPTDFVWRNGIEGQGLAAGLYFGRIRTENAVSRTFRLRLVR